jgi:hypothetical protein
VLLTAVEIKPIVVIGRGAYSASTRKVERGDRRRVSHAIQQCWRRRARV